MEIWNIFIKYICIIKIISDYKENSFEDSPQSFYLIPAMTLDNEKKVLENIKIYTELNTSNYETTYEVSFFILKNKSY